MPDKRRERFYFELLRKAVPEIPPGDAEEPEPPDFMLMADDGTRLSIELTEFHLPPAPGEQPHQERQSLKEHIVSLAERIHHDAGGPALYVSVFFDLRRRFSKKDIQPLARAIAASVRRAPVPRSVYEPVEIPWGRRPEATWGIHILPSVDGEDRLWHADMGGWVADISPQHVAATISGKARGAAQARRQCDKLWLVIVGDSFSRAAPAEISAEAIAGTYEGPFDRLLWLIPYVPQALDLRLMTSAGGLPSEAPAA